MSHGLKVSMFGLLFVASAASAQEAEIVVSSDYLKMGWEQVSGEVKFGDLNLKTDSGVDTFNQRVKAEAMKLCGVTEASLRDKANHNRCYDSVLASAKPQVEKLTATARSQ